ncbi:MAG: DedA family protein [Spirochaetes bacterium]|nr:MAG: DedA family protein [Spirochaetota bacterium]
MGITEFLVDYITRLIAAGGYPAIFVLMGLESMVAPVPSEAIMPFAGFLIVEGQFSFAGVVAVSTLGSIAGSLISYYMGAWGGEPFVKRFGKYLLLDVHHLETTKSFFARYGEKAIFISRFIPVVRHLISIPAGVGKMNALKFSAYTIAGAGMWNAFLAWVGFVLKENWSEVRKYSEVVDIVVVAGILGVCAYFIYSQVKRVTGKGKNAAP